MPATEQRLSVTRHPIGASIRLPIGNVEKLEMEILLYYFSVAEPDLSGPESIRHTRLQINIGNSGSDHFKRKENCHHKFKKIINHEELLIFCNFCRKRCS